uniref:Uncharacterized protein n=1 Tax=Megaselia scalaris TaxID=36166 RepID=T1GI57_MEGSC
HQHHNHHHHHHSSNSSSSSSCRGRTSIGGGGIGIGEGGGRRTSGGDVGSVHSSCSISSSNSADFQLNNYSYEQLNNVKNRENSKPPNTVNNNNNNNNNNLNNNINNNLSSSNTTNTTNLDRTNNNDTARILSEKNALEKNLKKHSLFINALSWKRLASSHGKKKLESNQKNKAANLPTATFRPPLADAIHPLQYLSLMFF